MSYHIVKSSSPWLRRPADPGADLRAGRMAELFRCKDLSASARDELRSISRESDPGFFAESLFAWALAQEKTNREDLAAVAYAALAQQDPLPFVRGGTGRGRGREPLPPPAPSLQRRGEVPADIRQQAQRGLEALRGQGRFGESAEGFLRRLGGNSETSVLWAGMALGSGLFAGARAAMLSRLARGLAADLVASAGAFAVEIPAVWAATKGLNELIHPGSQAWDAKTNLRELTGLALGLAPLKLIGGASSALLKRPLSGWIQEPVMLGGVVLGQRCNEWAWDQTPVSASQAVMDGLAMLLHARIGAHLMRGVLPGLHAFSQELSLRRPAGQEGLKISWESSGMSRVLVVSGKAASPALDLQARPAPLQMAPIKNIIDGLLSRLPRELQSSIRSLSGNRGDVEHIHSQLLAWSRQPGSGRQGMVEFADETARLRVLSQLRESLAAEQIPLHEIVLDVRQLNQEPIFYNLAGQLKRLPFGVVSIQGFEAAHLDPEKLYNLLWAFNDSRSHLAQTNHRQLIWWVPPFVARHLSALEWDIFDYLAPKLQLVSDGPVLSPSPQEEIILRSIETFEQASQLARDILLGAEKAGNSRSEPLVPSAALDRLDVLFRRMISQEQTQFTSLFLGESLGSVFPAVRQAALEMGEVLDTKADLLRRRVERIELEERNFVLREAAARWLRSYRHKAAVLSSSLLLDQISKHPETFDSYARRWVADDFPFLTPDDFLHLALRIEEKLTDGIPLMRFSHLKAFALVLSRLDPAERPVRIRKILEASTDEYSRIRDLANISLNSLGVRRTAEDIGPNHYRLDKLFERWDTVQRAASQLEKGEIGQLPKLDDTLIGEVIIDIGGSFPPRITLLIKDIEPLSDLVLVTGLKEKSRWVPASQLRSIRALYKVMEDEEALLN